MDLSKLISNSINWRKERFDENQTNTFRLFAGLSDGIEGLFIDHWGAFTLIALYNHELAKYKEEILISVQKQYPDRAYLLKIRQKDSKDAFLYERHNLKESLTCLEAGLRYEIHTNPKHDYGLYLDTKAARSFLSKICKDKTVLNLFAYTCPFGVSAMCSGAKTVTNIDPNKEYLFWGGKNAELNNIMFKKYPDTTQDYLKKHLRRLESGKDDPYDLIVVDPPAFLVGRGSERVARNVWPDWMRAFNHSGCNEFLIVINDKSIAKQGDLTAFFRDGFNSDLSVVEVEQSPDVTGQKIMHEQDKFYLNPQIFHLKLLK